MKKYTLIHTCLAHLHMRAHTHQKLSQRQLLVNTHVSQHGLEQFSDPHYGIHLELYR